MDSLSARLTRPAPGPALVGVPTDRKFIGAHPFQVAGEKYLRALVDCAVGLPLLLPSLAPPLPLEDLLGSLDGLLLTGSLSNIEPHHYSEEPSWEGNLHDPHRDATTLPLLRRALAAGLPVLALCRGLQEVNVAFGGTLWQRVHETPGMADHREEREAELEVQYGPAHPVHLHPGGLLAGIAGSEIAMVNSLHGQGIRRLGHGLRIEATAPDGLIEAVALDPEVDSGSGAGAWLLAVQWHPEWRATENPFYRGIFAAFAEAVARRRAQRN